jgi:bacteriocin biosynthesis cyclodehydratase domain-containing protein
VVIAEADLRRDIVRPRVRTIAAVTSSETGVLGAVARVMGTLQAAEVLKEITGAGESMSGHLLIYDGLETQFRKVRVPADPACPLCGKTTGNPRCCVAITEADRIRSTAEFSRGAALEWRVE